MLFGFSKVEIPICEECKTKFRIQRWGRELASWILVIIAIWIVSPHFSTWPSLTRKIVVGSIAILSLLPSILIEVLWPRIFTTTAQNNKVEYEFADEEYAREFYNLNKSDVIKSDFDEL